MKTKVYSFRADVNLIPKGTNVKEFVIKGLERKKTDGLLIGIFIGILFTTIPAMYMVNEMKKKLYPSS